MMRIRTLFFQMVNGGYANKGTIIGKIPISYYSNEKFAVHETVFSLPNMCRATEWDKERSVLVDGRRSW